MSQLLPPQGHPARELFDVSDLVAVGVGEHPVPCGIYHARRLGRATLAANPAARRVALFCLDATNDQLRLVSVGRRGGVKVEWTFGQVTRNTRLL